MRYAPRFSAKSFIICFINMYPAKFQALPFVFKYIAGQTFLSESLGESNGQIIFFSKKRVGEWASRFSTDSPTRFFEKLLG